MKRRAVVAAAVLGAAIAERRSRRGDGSRVRRPGPRCASAPVSTRRLRPGRGPALLVFFSTDCHVCYDDLFEARYLVDKGRWPVTVIGVSSGPREALREFLEKHAWALPVVLDIRKALFKRFKAGAVPFKALLVGSEVAYRDDPYLGLEERRKELERCLTRLFSR